MSKVEFRKAVQGDCVWAGERLLETLYGYGTYQVGLGDRDRASDVLRDYFRLRANRFSHQFSTISMVGGEPAGLLVVFPGAKLLRLSLAASLQMVSVYRPGEIVEFIRRAIRLRDEEEVGRDEFYIAHLAVSPAYRRQGIGHRLLEYAHKLAVEKGMNKLALMAEIENSGAIALYRKFGFSVTEKILHPHQIPLTGSPGYVKMVKRI